MWGARAAWVSPRVRSGCLAGFSPVRTPPERDSLTAALGKSRRPSGRWLTPRAAAAMLAAAHASSSSSFSRLGCCGVCLAGHEGRVVSLPYGERLRPAAAHARNKSACISKGRPWVRVRAMHPPHRGRIKLRMGPLLVSSQSIGKCAKGGFVRSSCQQAGSDFQTVAGLLASLHTSGRPMRISHCARTRASAAHTAKPSD